MMLVWSLCAAADHAPNSQKEKKESDIVSGRPVDDGIADHAVLLYDRAKDNLCSGMVVEGCVLTAGHCVPDGATPEVFKGRRPNLKGPSASTTGEVVRLGDGTTPERDIAVVKLNRPLRPWVNRTQLATKRLEVPTPPKFMGGEVVAFGNTRTDDTINKESKKNDLVDGGSGEKRWGNVLVQGYGAADDVSAQLGQPVLTKGNVLWVARGPSIVAQGDSGGYLMVNGQFHGIISAITGPRLPSLKTDHPRKDQPYAGEVTGARLAPIPDNHKAIIAALDKLGCAENTPNAMFQRLNALIARHGERLTDPAALPEADREELETLMRNHADFGTRTPAAVTAEVRNGQITFTITSTFGGRSVSTTPMPLRP